MPHHGPLLSLPLVSMASQIFPVEIWERGRGSGGRRVVKHVERWLCGEFEEQSYIVERRGTSKRETAQTRLLGREQRRLPNTAGLPFFPRRSANKRKNHRRDLKQRISWKRTRRGSSSRRCSMRSSAICEFISPGITGIICKHENNQRCMWCWLLAWT